MTRRTILQAAGAGISLRSADAREKAAVVIYGATPGGIAAAVAAARLGQSVLLCEYEDHIGGIVSNGLTNADIGKRQAVGGLFYEFTRRVVRYYEEMDRDNPARPNVKLCRDGYWYEANAAERIFHEMIAAEQGRIRLLLRHELKRAIVTNNRLTAIALEDRARPGSSIEVEGGVFIDATYEGDLAAMSGAPFRTGREGRAEYGEPHAGVIYMKFRGDEILAGSTGAADDTTQAYCFRFHVTNDPAQRIRIEKPAAYNRDDYRFLLEDIRAGHLTKFSEAIQVYPMPNGRFELNSNNIIPGKDVPSESLDLAEECWDWPTATPARRRAIYERYLSHNVGMIWLLQNDPEIPAPLRADASQYGWRREEWPANGHVPRQVYVRQGRRIVGDYILTEHDADLDSRAEAHARPTHQHRRGRVGFRPARASSLRSRASGYPGGLYFSWSMSLSRSRTEFWFRAASRGCWFRSRARAVTSPTTRSAWSRCLWRWAKPVELRPTSPSAAAWRSGARLFPSCRLCWSSGAESSPSTKTCRSPILPSRRCNGSAPEASTAVIASTKDAKLTRADAAGRLARILRFHGRSWTGPRDNPDAPLSASDLRDWLKQAGYRAASTGASALDLTEFASTVYQAMRPG